MYRFGKRSYFACFLLIVIVIALNCEKLIFKSGRSWIPIIEPSEPPIKTTLETLKPRKSVIVTTWRSGSTFLGDVLNALPGNYYHYEPLMQMGIRQIRGPPLSDRAVTQLQNLLNCDYEKSEEYLNYAKQRNSLFMHNKRLWKQCLENSELCQDSTELTKFCRSFSYQSMKVVRIRLNLIENLIKTDMDGPRIILLVRDPRGTLESRKHRDWCIGQPDCDHPSILCDDLVSDYLTAVRFSSLYPNRFATIRYEELALEADELIPKIFEFLGIDFHPAVREFLNEHTKQDKGGVNSTFRNSKDTPFRWTKKLPFTEVRMIQEKCTKALSYWGYNIAHNQSELISENYSPLGDYSIEQSTKIQNGLMPTQKR